MRTFAIAWDQRWAARRPLPLPTFGPLPWMSAVRQMNKVADPIRRPRRFIEVSGRLCIENVNGDGQFGCGDRFELVYLTPSVSPDEWHVAADEFPVGRMVGYIGNVFDFK